MRRRVGVVLLSLGWALGGCAKSLHSYSHLVKPDQPVGGGLGASRGRGVEITYLGVNGYLLRDRRTVLLIDPYFSRHSLTRIGLNAEIEPDGARVAEGLEGGRVPRRIDGILVTHGHFDHLSDVPEVQRRCGGVIVASPTSCNLARSAGVENSRLREVMPGAEVRVGGAKVRVLEARHDLLLGRVPYAGQLTKPLDTGVGKPRQWVSGTPLAFLIEMGGKRIYLDSGGVPGTSPDAVAHGVDLAILGVALPTSRQRYVKAVESLGARHVLPSHQDNMFLPLSRGFRFSTVSNFEAVLSAHRELGMGSRSELVMLDYFRPWEIP